MFLSQSPVPSWLSIIMSVLSHVQLFMIPLTVACQAPLSMGSFRQKYWSGFPCPPPGNLPHPQIKPTLLTSPALAGGFLTTSAIWEAQQTFQFSSVQFSHSVLSDSLRPHESQHARPPCPSPTPGVYSNSCPLSNIYGVSILCPELEIQRQTFS